MAAKQERGGQDVIEGTRDNRTEVRKCHCIRMGQNCEKVPLHHNRKEL